MNILFKKKKPDEKDDNDGNDDNEEGSMEVSKNMLLDIGPDYGPKYVLHFESCYIFSTKMALSRMSEKDIPIGKFILFNNKC